jgi:glutathione S-transferase
VANFYVDFNARLVEAPFLAGERFSAADITALVTVDFATRALNMPIPAECTAFKRWHDTVAARESMTA